MENQIVLVTRRSGEATPFNAGDAMAAVCVMYEGGLTHRQRGRLGRTAKELLAGGYAPDVVCAAMLAGLKRARIGYVEDIALEIQNAKLDQLMTYRQYRALLDRATNEATLTTHPELRALREMRRRHLNGTARSC